MEGWRSFDDGTSTRVEGRPKEFVSAKNGTRLSD